MNGLSSLNETYRKYSLALADNLNRFWGQRSRSQQAVEVVNSSTLMLGHRSPSSKFDAACTVVIHFIIIIVIVGTSSSLHTSSYALCANSTK